MHQNQFFFPRISPAEAFVSTSQVRTTSYRGQNNRAWREKYRFPQIRVATKPLQPLYLELPKLSTYLTTIQTEGESKYDPWESYREIMSDIMNRDRVIQMKAKKSQTGENATLSLLGPVQDYLLSSDPILPQSQPISAPNFRNQLKEQHQLFGNTTQWTKEQHDYCQRSIAYTADYCAKHKCVGPAQIAWYKLREIGMLPRENTVSTFMYVLSLDEESEQQKWVEEVATFHDALYEPNEKTISLRIKALIQQKLPLEAENLLFTLPDKGKVSAEWKRLRTFLPILEHYCEHKDLASALKLFRYMRSSEGVIFDDNAYAMILEAAVAANIFHSNSPPLERLSEFGFNCTNGPHLFNQLMLEMSEDLLELSELAASRIFRAFAGSMSNSDGIPPCKVYSNNIMTGRTKIDESDGICPYTGVKLKLFTLTLDQKKHVHDTLLDMAYSQHEEFGLKLKKNGKDDIRRDGQYAYDKLLEFSTWLTSRDATPYTAIIDGANVAYFGHGDVHFSQVQHVVSKLEAMGETPLVVMPKKYTQKSFWLQSLSFTQKLTDRDLGVLDQLSREGKLYIVPANCLDDYYWMISSVVKQKWDDSIDIPPADKGRFPGVRPMLVTNDQMRDHKLSLLEPRLFRRWTSSHIVNYDLKPYNASEWEARDVTLFPCESFSREIQGNVGGNGSTKTTAKTTVWHIPVSEWSDHCERLCLSIIQS